MGESGLHQKVQLDLGDLLKAANHNLAATMGHEEVRGRLQKVKRTGTEEIVLSGRLNTCPDISFTESPSAVPGQPVIPSLVAEIC